MEKKTQKFQVIDPAAMAARRFLRTRYADTAITDIDTIAVAVSELPKAKLMPIYAHDPRLTGPAAKPLLQLPIHRAVVMDIGGREQPVAVVSDRYALVQHQDAFAPVITDLKAAGKTQNLIAKMSAEGAKADMSVYLAEAVSDGTDGGVLIGYSITSAHTGRDAITYSFQLDAAYGYIELAGFRQVCSNGMKVRVPLNEATIVKLEAKKKIEALISHRAKIRHVSAAQRMVLEQAFFVQALALAAEPVKVMIENARKIPVTHMELKRLLELNFPSVKEKTARKEVAERFEQVEEKTMWGFYNAMTYYATHRAHERFKDGIFDRSAELLTNAALNRVKL